MLPGANCLACHEAGVPGDGDEEEEMTAAGTVFADEWGTMGAANVIVRIIDATGYVVEKTSNSVGNFYTGRDLVFPITAQVERDGKVLEMDDPVDEGGCNSCHSCSGEAEGKLYAP